MKQTLTKRTVWSVILAVLLALGAAYSAQMEHPPISRSSKSPNQTTGIKIPPNP